MMILNDGVLVALDLMENVGEIDRAVANKTTDLAVQAFDKSVEGIARFRSVFSSSSPSSRRNRLVRYS